MKTVNSPITGKASLVIDGDNLLDSVTGNLVGKIINGTAVSLTGDTIGVINNAEGSTLDLSFVTATADDIMSGKVGCDSSGNPLYGKIAKKGAETFTPGVADQNIQQGVYLSGVQTIKGDANLVAENIKKGVSIFGVIGTYEAASSGEEDSGGDSGGDDSGSTTAEDWERLVVSGTGDYDGTYIAVEKSGNEPNDFTNTIWTLNGGSAGGTTCLIKSGTLWKLASSKYLDFEYAYNIPDTSPAAPWDAMTWSISGMSVKKENV
jgi:hypothetical protein